MLHPKITYPGELAPIVEALARPLHTECHRDRSRTARAGCEVSLEDGYEIVVEGFGGHRHFDTLLAGWREFFAKAMGVGERAGGYPLRLLLGQPAGVPAGAPEAHDIDIRAEGAVLTAPDVDGLRRALFRLEDEMLLRRAPILPLTREARWAKIASRITRSSIAPYRWLSGWELEDDDNDYYPEAYLARLSRSGINGLWVPGLFRNLIASRTLPELGPSSHRLGKLRDLVERAARHGIKIYFFCIEPRALPPDHKASKAHPEITGVHKDIFHTLCTETPLVLEYLREVTGELFREVPDLGGLINIFCGERPTSCAWNERIMKDCPRCKGGKRTDKLADILNAMAAGISDAGASSAEFLAWSYIIGNNRETAPIAPMLEVLDKTSPTVSWLVNFEHGGAKEVCGKPHVMHEYALSYTGPSEPFIELAEAARRSGKTVFAKLQIGTSCEMASVPYIPVPGVVVDKMAGMHRLGVTGSLLTWTFGAGGWPGPMLKAAGEAAFEPDADRAALLRRLAGIEWGEDRAGAVASAWDIFGQAWEEYPMELAVLYYGPVTRAPAYPLHLEQEVRTSRLYNFGMERNRDLQHWTAEVERWTGALGAEEIIAAFRRVASRWQEGLALLEEAAQGGGAELQRQVAVAEAVRLQCLSTANVYEFYSLRDRLREAPESEQAVLVRRLREVAEDELQRAGEMLGCLEVEPALGYFIELYARVYSPTLVEEKIRHVRATICTLRRWEAQGVEVAMLYRTVEEAERLRPDRWGD